MKTKLSRKLKQAASALLTTLVICSIFSLFVMYYLSLIEQQSFLSSRSQVWYIAIAASEAGIEDGMQQINSNWPNMATDGWTYQGNYAYYRSNSLPDGNGYAAWIITSNFMHPSVISRAYVQSPTWSAFAALGLSSEPTIVNRAVQVHSTKGNLLTAAIVAKHKIELNGNGVMTDSFDSAYTNKSTNGQYDKNKAGDKGDVASNDGIVNSVDVGNANIYGTAHTGPGQGTLDINGGAVGSHEWQKTHNGLEPGWFDTNANFTFPDTAYPNTASYFSPTGGVLVTQSNYLTWTTNSGTTYPTNFNAGPSMTNIIAWMTNSVAPDPAPPGTLTVNTMMTTLFCPSPVPLGIVTNYSTQWFKDKFVYPAPGTYVGTVQVNGNTYSYWGITGIASYSYPITQYICPTYNYTYGLSTTHTLYFTNSYDHILWGTNNKDATNYYTTTDLTGSTIVIGMNVTVAVSGGINMGPSDSFTVAAAGSVVGCDLPNGSVRAYVGGTSCTLYGNGIMNQPGYAYDLIVFCAPTVTTLTLGGNAGFTGVVVAPSADLNMNGGGMNNIDFNGSVMVNSVTLNGHYSFHYDEALSRFGLEGRFLVTTWNEVK